MKESKLRTRWGNLLYRLNRDTSELMSSRAGNKILNDNCLKAINLHRSVYEAKQKSVNSILNEERVKPKSYKSIDLNTIPYSMLTKLIEREKSGLEDHFMVIQDKNISALVWAAFEIGESLGYKRFKNCYTIEQVSTLSKYIAMHGCCGIFDYKMMFIDPDYLINPLLPKEFLSIINARAFNHEKLGASSTYTHCTPNNGGNPVMYTDAGTSSIIPPSFNGIDTSVYRKDLLCTPTRQIDDSISGLKIENEFLHFDFTGANSLEPNRTVQLEACLDSSAHSQNSSQYAGNSMLSGLTFENKNATQLNLVDSLIPTSEILISSPLSPTYNIGLNNTLIDDGSPQNINSINCNPVPIQLQNNFQDILFFSNYDHNNNVKPANLGAKDPAGSIALNNMSMFLDSLKNNTFETQDQGLPEISLDNRLSFSQSSLLNSGISFC
ncbi:hypothetical protein AX774_g2221 [Zancudomyces culisetae]|uniref:Uncharacterized protein n=1 Tax=Zancudomyces culisetae TaxID=1213189 RepID=A0A1R1PTD1_ZANCU|nr:hypothetical protein AX774_g2221 [Zancudomyces culisetae]|eukprot:OMH84255.1 hypothetical protein AX774_g2221 [Zancudomyces culisetae]